MATDFFAAQDAARQRSRHLIWLFLASVAGLIVAIYGAVNLLILFMGETGLLWRAEVFLGVAGLTSLIVGISSAVKIAGLRAGGGSVARSIGGRPVDPSSADPDERRLVNVVEEMAIASGVPVPEVYVLDAEDGINAFAAGFSPDDAAVAVTRGCMTKLSRDELQGVVAHEFSHILNGDMRLNIHLIGLVFGLLVLSVVGQGLLRASVSGGGSRRRNGKDGAAPIAALGLILLAAGWIGVLFGRLLQSAVSRQREFLADASAVQFTRNPSGLAGALRKIAGAGSRVNNEHSQDVAHLFFANGVRTSWAGLFATHPPLADRIRALDPSWDGSMDTTPPPDPGPAPEGMAFAVPPAVRGGTMRDNLAAQFGGSLHNPATASALVLALFPPLDGTGDPTERDKLTALGPEERNALVGLLMPALGHLSPEDRQALLARLDDLSGEGLDAFSFGLWWIVRRHLRRLVQPFSPQRRLAAAPAIFAPDVAVLIASLVHIGTAPGDEERSFEQALAASPSFQPLSQYPGGQPDILQLDGALTHLGGASFALRREIIDAATVAVTADRVITSSEEALLRLVSLALDCPAPLPAIPAGSPG
jgi:Zn-dependent protease with chaperone function